MTDDKIALRELLEKNPDGTFPRDMISFAAERVMALETEALCGEVEVEVDRFGGAVQAFSRRLHDAQDTPALFA